MKSNMRQFWQIKSYIILLVMFHLMSVMVAVAQQTQEPQDNHRVRGVVTEDKTGRAIPRVSVKVLSTGVEVFTDSSGKFTVEASSKDKLQVSLAGYATRTLKIGKQQGVSISLRKDKLELGEKEGDASNLSDQERESKDLDEVVVTAFATGQKKESVVGAIQTIKPSSLRMPSANLSTGFAGRIAGMIAFQRRGQPGSNGANFFIRGISTISGVTSPLIILDGVEVSSGDINAIDPDIIEGFSVLKDATATAMYGSRGANGVMIVTTKSGANLEKPVIGFRLESYITTPTKIPKFVSGPKYMKLFNEAVTNQGTGDVLFTDQDIQETISGVDPYVFPNVNWYDEVFDNVTFNQRANFNIRGGTKKITYFMNITVNRETGMLKNRSKDFFSYSNNIELMKYAFQNNIDFHLSKSSMISLHLNAQLNDQTSPVESVGDIYGTIMNSNPVDFPAFFPNTGEKWVKWGAFSGGYNQGAANPLARLVSGYSNFFSSAVIANINFDQKLDVITKGLRFNALFSFKNYGKTTTDRSQRLNRYHKDSISQNPDGGYRNVPKALGVPTKPVLSTSRSSYGDRRIYFQTYMDYTRSFGDHYLSSMVLFNMDEFSLNTGGDLLSSLPKRKMGFAFRASYDYGHRYLFEFNAGYNGSENFAPERRFGFFPSVALGWNVSQEKFWQPIRRFISRLKLRGSYGLVGNDQIGGDRFIYTSDVSLQAGPAFTTGYGNDIVSRQGPTYTRFQNNDLTWEIGAKLNVGMDIQLFNALDLTIDVFEEIRSNIFQRKASVPNYLGTANTAIYGNFGKVKNWGMDVAVNYSKRISKDFSLQAQGTFTFARNRVLEYDQAPEVRPANSRIGQPVNVIYGFISDGLYIDQADVDRNPTSTLSNIKIAPGDIKYVDQPDKKGLYDNKITSDDKVAMGYPTIPEIVYGFGVSLAYKGWDLSFFFQGVANTSLMMSGFHPFGAQTNRNVLQFVADNYWSETNQNRNVAYPRLTKSENGNNNQASDFWLRNGAFLKLKNVEIGYSYKNMRLYISGINLLIFSPFDLWDPEMGGGAGLVYPTQRTVNVGFQMSFNK